MTATVSLSEISTGSILAGKYRVERMIGQGGMGVVLEARHTTLDDRVALKFLLPEYATHPEASQRFLREARAAVKIKSSHVARVSDVGTLESGAPYMVMEYLEGCDAAHLLAQGQPLPVGEAVDYIVQAGDAIAEAHALGIIHRDIKPANLFVTRHQDGSPFVKLLDFGISKMTNEAGVSDNLTRTTATMGSALYMSPEQIRQSKSVDHRTDIYALGVSLYELLTARQPFLAESFAALCVEIATGTPTPLRELRPELPPEFAAIVERAYARDPDQRYQNIAQFVVALAPWAPPRSQPIIERIARAAGLVPRFDSNPPAADPGRSGYAHVGLSDSAERGMSGSSPGAPAATNLSGSATVPPTARSPIKSAIAVAVALVLFAGLIAVVLWKKSSTLPAAPAASDSSISVAGPAPEPPPRSPVVDPKIDEPSSAASVPKPPASASAPTQAGSKVAVRSDGKKTASAKTGPVKPEPPPEPPKPPPTPTKSPTHAEDYR